MGWQVQYREKDKKYRLWSTISDRWITNWSTKKDIQAYIARDLLLDYKKRLIEVYLEFPHHWPDKDGKTMRYIQDEAGYQAYGAWLHTLASATAENYEELIENKYNEVMRELGLGEKE